jgi:hypothetical protein
VVVEKTAYQFFDVGSGKSLSRIPRSDEIFLLPNGPAFSARGTYFAYKEKDDRVELYEVRTGKRLRSLFLAADPAKPGVVLGFQFSADEQTLLGEVRQQLSFEGRFSREKVCLRLWDVQAGEAFQEIVLDPQDTVFFREAMMKTLVQAMALSPDRRLVALAKVGDTDIELWETASGRRRGVLAGHEGPVVSLSFSADGKHLASGSEDTTVLVWDLHRPPRPATPTPRLRAGQLAKHWQTLLGPDAEAADLAVWGLVAAARDAVPFLKGRLRPAARPDAGRLRRALADLGSDSYKTRAAATAEIGALGEGALGELRKAVRQTNDLEKQRRLEALLRAAREAARPFGTAEAVRRWRALEVLEKAATPEAVGLLKELAGGAPGARLTVEARAALDRLARRAKRPR